MRQDAVPGLTLFFPTLLSLPTAFTTYSSIFPTCFPVSLSYSSLSLAAILLSYPPPKFTTPHFMFPSCLSFPFPCLLFCQSLPFSHILSFSTLPERWRDKAISCTPSSLTADHFELVQSHAYLAVYSLCLCCSPFLLLPLVHSKQA